MPASQTLATLIEDVDYYRQDPALTLDVLRETHPIHYYEPPTTS
ncbi:hypothetical protein AB0I54_35850 [Streptomyces sp. NPDC050625]